MTGERHQPTPSRRDLLVGGGALALASASPARAAPLDPIARMSAIDLRAAIGGRKVSCVEVAKAYLARIDAVNPALNAIVSRAPAAEVLREAAARDAQLARGEAVGPLHGFPVAIKDLVEAKGLRSTLGSPIFDHIATEDDPYVAKIRAAGAVFIGMTNVPEFGMGSHTFNPVFGATLNPYDRTKSASGSTGGGAVAVATHMLPVADGSDHAGSLRNPAAWNNIYGFRPSYGRVVGPGNFNTGLSVNGAMGRSPADLGLLLSVMSGYDIRSPLSIDEDPKVFAGDLRRDFKGVRIGWLGDFGGGVPYETGVLDLCASTFPVFEQLGGRVEAAVPDMPVDRVWDAWVKLRAWEEGSWLVSSYKDPAKRALMKPEAIFEVESSLNLKWEEVSAAMQTRNRWYRAVAALFDRYDFLLAPGGQVFPFDVKARWPQEIAGKPMRTYHEWMQGLVMITMAGLPSICVPAGFGRGGLPMGVQIIGRRNRDLDCLQLADAYHRATNWPARRPPPQVTA
jgi:amidase